MNTQEAKIVGCRKAWIAFVAALSCLIIYILACVLSPPAWSPDSSKIAILVTPPGEKPDTFAIFAYDIQTGERTLLDEVKADGVLSAPAWSPDGKWIAYYKVEPEPSPEVIPASEPDATVSAGNGSGNTTKGKSEQPKPPTTTQELFSEENKMLPSLMLELMEELVEEQEDAKTFDVKLIMVTPDAKERKILQVMKWMGDDDEVRVAMMHIRPSWSADCKRLFYVRVIEDLFYTGSIDIATGKTYAHLVGSIGTPVVSPDGKWVASCLKDSDTLIAVRIEGNISKYFRLDLKMDNNYLLMQDGMFWSPDAKKIFVVAEDSTLHAVDITSGQIEQYSRADANNINAFYTLSSTGEKLYYITGLDDEEEVLNITDRIFSLRYMNLQNKSKGTLFSLSGFPEHSEGGRFSISPNGKIVLLRALIDNRPVWPPDRSERARSVLIFCDGKTQKVLSTDRWLLKPFYSDSNLIFEEKLIGNWRGEDVRIFITKGAQEKTYRLTWAEDEEEHHAAANLVQLKSMMFLGIFLDESVLEEKDSYGSHLLPDRFIRIYQIEPKLLLQPMEYDEVAEMLKASRDEPAVRQEGAESLKREGIETEDILEFERTNSSPEISNVPDNRT
ncbi:MAG: hypothetical protein WAV28_04025 [Sedimentisphaerales bacterium]